MKNWPLESNRDIGNKVILFLISPFIAFLYSLRTFNRRSSFIVFYLFFVFFGIAFTVPSGRTINFTSDAADYREQFESYKNVSENDFINGFKSFLSFDEGNKDYYFDTVAYFVSRFTDNYHVMFMIFAMVFAYFSLKSFKFFTADFNTKATIASYILIYLFMTNQIFNINGMRFWTAAWIGIYCIFQIFKHNDNRYWILALSTPFFHGSFWIFLGVLLIAQFTRKFEKLWVVLFILSFFVSNLSIELVHSYQEYLPVFLSKMVDSYTDLEYIQLRRNIGTGYSWIPYTFGIISRLYFAILMYIFIKNSKLIRANIKSENLYLLLLVWVTIFNFLSFIPSLGGRYLTFAWPLTAYIWQVNFLEKKKYQKILYAMPLVSAWSIFIMFFREYPSVLEWDFYFSSPFYLVFKYLIFA